MRGTLFPPARPMAADPAHHRLGPPDPRRIASLFERLADDTIDVAPGPWSPTASRGAAASLGLVVLDGLLLRELRLDGVATAQLVIDGEIVDPLTRVDSVLCREDVTWRAVEPTTLAVLGDRFLAAAQRQPALYVALRHRHARQMHRAARYAAIAQLPRVDQRLVSLLRSLAEDRGRV